MSTIFTILAMRITVVVVALTSVSMGVVTVIARSQPPFDPFAPYADIMPGQSREALIARGFRCEFTRPPSYDESCLLITQTGIFSEIRASISYETGRVHGRVVFIVREKMLVLGDLARLWGKPQIVSHGQTANFRFPKMRVVSVIQNYRGHWSYWLPITYVAFESDT